MNSILKRCLQWALFLGCGGILFALPVQGATQITVTTTDDVIADDGHCSLREAIIAANRDAAFHDCPAGSGADAISFDLLLPAPRVVTLTLAGADENDAETGDLDVSGALTLIGADPGGGDNVVIDGNGADRVLEVLSQADVRLVGVTLRNGNPGAAANGGGVLVDLAARLALTDSQVISNSALSGGGLYSVGGVTISGGAVSGNRGGGITNQGGLLTLHGVAVDGNVGGCGIASQGRGALTMTGGVIRNNEGGICNAEGNAALDGLTVMGNTGGGIANTGFGPTHLTLQHSAVVSNTGISGAGLLNEGVGAVLDVIDSRVSGNEAGAAGGGIFNNGILSVQRATLDHNRARAGGGIDHFGGELSLTNATVSGNSAADNGGGIYAHAATTLRFTTLAANGAGGSGGNLFIDEAPVTVDSTIVAAAGSGDNCANSAGYLTSLGHNLESANTCNFGAADDLANVDPLIGALADNGGPNAGTAGAALTHALLAGSPAIDHGSLASCPATDQRGGPRPHGAACDSGAYEWNAVAPTPTPSPTPTPVPTQPPALPLQIVVTPTMPTVSDPISISVSGVYTTSCTPEYQAHQVAGNEIAIQSQLPDQTFCLNVETPWGYSIGLDPLPAGVYTVTHTLENRTDTKTFTVTNPAGQCAARSAQQPRQQPRQQPIGAAALPIVVDAPRLFLALVSNQGAQSCQ